MILKKSTINYVTIYVHLKLGYVSSDNRCNILKKIVTKSVTMLQLMFLSPIENK